MTRDAPFVVGLTVGRTQDGRPQIDGAACLISEQQVVAVAEERITRKKHAGGCSYALQTLLHQAGLTSADIDLYVVSTCGEPLPGAGAPIHLRTDGMWTLQDLGVDSDRIHWCPWHHLSHAWHAATFRTQSKALIAILDRQGISGEWNSFFLSDESDIYLIGRDDVPPSSVGGVGATYAAVSDWLGYPGDRQAGTTMALAGYGTPQNLRLLDASDDGSLYSSFGRSLPDYFKQSGHGAWCDAIIAGKFQARADLAATMQYQLENRVTQRIQSLCDQQGCCEVILGGGVATNCQLVGFLRRTMPDVVVRIPSAPGDTGQALGNALYGWSKIMGRSPPPASRIPFLGPERGMQQDGTWQTEINATNLIDSSHVVKQAVDVLMRGGVLGLCYGRSEYGPRALGHRSVLAHPGFTQAKERIMRIKSREWFRPFGAVWMAGCNLYDRDASRRGKQTSSPFMDAAISLPTSLREQLPAVMHVDGTCRVQTMEAQCHGEPLDQLLQELHQSSGLPCLLNTSFNRRGEPLVESFVDVLSVGQSMALDALWIPDRGLFLQS